MSEHLISARRSAEYYNLQLLQGFVLIGTFAGTIAAGFAVVFSGGRIGTAAALGQATLLAGVSLSCAALVGFLFAVSQASGNTYRWESASRPNTNLEQISDWLTKGLVGAALASLGRFPEILDQIRDFATIGEHSGWGERIGLLVIVYFALMGFAAGFVLSRMQFITILDRAPFVITALQALQQMPIGPEGAHRTNLNLEGLSAVESFSRIPVRQLYRGNERRQWAKAQMVAVTGDLKAAVRVYDDFLKTKSDPQIVAERSFALRRLESEPNAKPLLGSSSKDSSLDLESAQAAVNQMFVSLYEPPPDGFERVLRIGEELVLLVQDSSIWAYLACAYGQKYRHLLDTPGASAAELDPLQERALFCVKEALDLDAAKWRATLRALWDRNAVRPHGDDDLVVFSDDPRFVALLDPDSVKVIAGTGTVLAPQRLVKYRGKVQIWLVDAQGSVLERERPKVRSGGTYRLFVRLVPESVEQTTSPPGGIVQEVRITEGDDRPRVEFDYRPDGVEIRFSPERSGITASLTEATTECGFNFQIPQLREDKPEAREIYVEIAQGRRIILTIPVKITILPTNV